MYKVMTMETAKDGLLVLTKDKQNVGIRKTMKILTNVAQPECRQQLVSERKLYNRKCAGHYATRTDRHSICGKDAKTGWGLTWPSCWTSPGRCPRPTLRR